MVMILIVGFSALKLKEANRISRKFVEHDIALIEIADDMVNALLSQELYGRRYIILKSPEMLELFWQRSRDFDAFISRIRKIQGAKKIFAPRLAKQHNEFNDLYVKWLKHLEDNSNSYTKEYDKKIKKSLEDLTDMIQLMIWDLKQNQKEQILKSGGIGLKTFQIMALLSTFGILLGIVAAYLITRNISRSIHQLKLATNEIAEGRFDSVLRLNTSDELGELANSFYEMSLRLKRLEEMYLDASPLTRLPGGIAIENVLKKRLSASIPVAFCLIDIDNFKSFNDRYGYVMGNEVIITTAEIIKTAVAQHGTNKDFVGHIGGDDFAIITTPEKYAGVCNSIVKEFDKKIAEFYDPDDCKRGFIVGKTRQGQNMNFPIMTVSIAVVTSNERSQMNHIEFGEIAAELKEYAKSLPGSLYVANRRKKNP